MSDADLAAEVHRCRRRLYAMAVALVVIPALVSLLFVTLW